MKERLIEFLKTENKSSAQLAEEIGVQPSGISHILSGRNNPSLDFILKMLEKYQHISTDWLLFGKEPMYKDIKMQTLFDENVSLDQKEDLKKLKNVALESEIDFQSRNKAEQTKDYAAPDKSNVPSVRKIVWFYENNSFEEFFPTR